MEDNFYNSLVGKRIRIVQKDEFTKSGLCHGFNEKFLFLEFNDGSDVAISLDSIVEIKILEGER